MTETNRLSFVIRAIDNDLEAEHQKDLNNDTI